MRQSGCFPCVFGDDYRSFGGFHGSFDDIYCSLVVFTGAFTPEAFKDSDADFNVGLALGALQSLTATGNSRVYVAMNGQSISPRMVSVSYKVTLCRHQCLVYAAMKVM